MCRRSDEAHRCIRNAAPERLLGVTCDSGALVAADKGERRMWARHRAQLVRRELPAAPAAVVAQSWRGSGRQAQLARLLAGCYVESLDEVRARSAGALAAVAATSDVVDACVVEGAMRRGDLVVSSDPDDLQRIADAAGRRLEIDHPDRALRLARTSTTRDGAAAIEQ